MSAIKIMSWAEARTDTTWIAVRWLDTDWVDCRAAVGDLEWWDDDVLVELITEPTGHLCDACAVAERDLDSDDDDEPCGLVS